MRNLRMLGSALAVAALLAACGSSAGPTANGNGGGGATEPAATEDAGQPGATDAGGGGGGTGQIDTSHGTAHIEITGAKSWTGDLGFLWTTSLFPSSGSATAILYFADNGTTSLSLSIDTSVSTATFATAEFGVALLPVNGVIGTCTVTTSKLESNSVEGTFKCEHSAVTNSDSTLGEATLSGTFTAHT